MTSRAHAPDRTFHSFPSVEEQTAFVPVVFGELTAESLARSYAEMRERIRRAAFGSPLLEDPADARPFGVDSHRAVEGACDDIPGADDAKAEASTLRDAGVPAVRVDEYQRRLSSLLGGGA